MGYGEEKGRVEREGEIQRRGMAAVMVGSGSGASRTRLRNQTGVLDPVWVSSTGVADVAVAVVGEKMQQ